jgi:uncharacterized membrane protein YqjE
VKVGAALNVVLLALVFCGYAEAERWRAAWLVAAAPVVVGVMFYGWRLFNQE